jgi:suppressor of ftsI
MPATTRRSFMTKTATLAALAPVLASTAKTASAEVGGRKLVLETRDMDMVVDGITCRVRAYNGQVPGPPIRTRPGEKMTITLKNGLAPVSSEGWNGDHNVPHGLSDTNLHFHGLDVRPHLFEPLGTLDPLAPMIAIKPGDSLDYPARPLLVPSAQAWRDGGSGSLRDGRADHHLGADRRCAGNQGGQGDIAGGAGSRPVPG